MYEVVIPPLRPPRIMPLIMLPERFVEPWLLVLLPLRMRLIWELEVKRPMNALPRYLRSGSISACEGTSVPAPAVIWPKSPRIISGCTERSMTVSSSPSSMPVNCDSSDFSWIILRRLTIFAGMFLEASWGSSRKKSLPSILIFDMVSPFAVMLPSSETSTPGSFLSRSSSMSLSVVLNDEAVYSTVSFFTITGFPTADTDAASSTVASSDSFMVPRSRVLPSTVISEL